jgi:hypothetical protein
MECEMPTIKDELMKAVQRFGGHAPVNGQRHLALMADAHIRLFKQIEDVNDAWSESIRRTKDAEAEFARRLADCDDAAKAVELSTDWLTSRAATFLAESQRFTGLWLTFYSDAVKAAWSGAAANPNSAPDGGPRTHSSP